MRILIERNAVIALATSNVGMIIPHSAFCTDNMAPVMKLFSEDGGMLWISTYAIRPAKLFADAEQRLAIYLHHKSLMIANQVTNYVHWKSEYRDFLLSTISYNASVTDSTVNTIAKTGSRLDHRLMEKLLRFGGDNHKSDFIQNGDCICYFHNAPRYWIRATDFVPYFWNERDGEKQSIQIKSLSFSAPNNMLAFCALMNSTLFYWWFIVCSDCRHLNMREIENFYFDPQQLNKKKLHELSKIIVELMESYLKNSVRKKTNYKTTGRVIYDEFYPRHSKHIIDKIDAVLAKHYGFTEEELDYIINYDIKYRMGLAK